MMNTQPKIFIASSGEQLDVAYAVQENLQDHAEITVWNQGMFGLSRYALESLFDTLDNFNFGIFIFTPDDTAKIKNNQMLVARDNIVFELGLFLGRYGRERCFIIQPAEADDLHLPTDFAGITTAHFKSTRSDNNLRAALGPACNTIRKQIGSIAHNESQIKVEPVQDDPYTLYVAVVCYRNLKGNGEIVLVRTTGGRWTLPKGKLSLGETKIEAAQRHARAKAGAVGTVDPDPLATVKHWRSSTGEIIPMTVFLLQVENSVPFFQVFRTPQWFDFRETSLALAEGRNPRYAEEGTQAVNNAIERLKTRYGLATGL
jgi:8-oxo-dGTP pyrophosphatase MutT (NUDIX family)